MGFTALFPPIAGLIVWPKRPSMSYSNYMICRSESQIGICGQRLLSGEPDGLFDCAVSYHRVCNFERDFAIANELDQALHLGRLDDFLHQGLPFVALWFTPHRFSLCPAINAIPLPAPRE